MVSIRKARKSGFPLRKRHGGIYDKEKVGLLVAGLCIGFVLVLLYTVAFSESSGENGKISAAALLRRKKKHPHLMEPADENDNETQKKHFMEGNMNAIALDIDRLLNCDKLLEEADLLRKQNNQNIGFDDVSINEESRRLQEDQHADDGGFPDAGEKGIQENQDGADDAIPEEKWGNQAWDEGNSPLLDDAGDFGGGYPSLNAQHLFCLAASESPPKSLTDEIKCDATNKKRRTLLDLWSTALPRIEKDLVKKVLGMASEQTFDIMGKSYDIWAPLYDAGSSYVASTLNTDHEFDGLEGALGPKKLFVDIGSCLGLTCLAINNKYPGTEIVSVEPAQPNWLLQEINMRCNLSKSDFKRMKIVLSGVSPNRDDEGEKMAKLMWRPTSTTSTRSWTPASEFKEGDEELNIRLRKLKSILAEADIYPPRRVDVMNLDCQGCEYNLIPALSEEEFEQIPTVMGRVHWGYINSGKLPSSRRGKTTHERLCRHENFARKTKECCAFPNLPVKSSIPGVVLQRNDSKGVSAVEITVADVVEQGLCEDFGEWSKDHFLEEINDDYSWFELSSQAEN